jgi:hypothetical protein
VTDRATSTALDAALFVLLVSGAAVTLAAAPTGPDRTPSARPTADLVAATTASVTYDDRTANGTVGTLLADAVSVRRRNGSAAFVDATRNATRRALRGAGPSQVVAVRRCAAVTRVVIGSDPPRGVTVTASAFRVPAPPEPACQPTVRVVVRRWSS